MTEGRASFLEPYRLGNGRAGTPLPARARRHGGSMKGRFAQRLHRAVMKDMQKRRARSGRQPACAFQIGTARSPTLAEGHRHEGPGRPDARILLPRSRCLHHARPGSEPATPAAIPLPPAFRRHRAGTRLRRRAGQRIHVGAGLRRPPHRRHPRDRAGGGGPARHPRRDAAFRPAGRTGDLRRHLGQCLSPACAETRASRHSRAHPCRPETGRRLPCELQDRRG